MLYNLLFLLLANEAVLIKLKEGFEFLQIEAQQLLSMKPGNPYTIRHYLTLKETDQDELLY